MLKSTLEIRTRYAETDQMGYVYYGHYSAYFEVGRAELFRGLGLTYRDLEEKYGIAMPVAELEIRYLAPAYYDDLLTVETCLMDMPTSSIIFYHTIWNAEQTKLTTGKVRLVFVNRNTMRPMRPPVNFMEVLAQNWQPNA